MNKTDKYEYKSYGEPHVELEHGLYSLSELKRIVAYMEKMSQLNKKSVRSDDGN